MDEGSENWFVMDRDYWQSKNIVFMEDSKPYITITMKNNVLNIELGEGIEASDAANYFINCCKKVLGVRDEK